MIIAMLIKTMTEAQWFGIGDHAEGGDRRQQQSCADTDEDGGGAGLRDARQNSDVRGREDQRKSKRKHAESREQAGDVLGPAAFGVVLRKEGEAVKDKTTDDEEVGNDRDG